MLHRVGNLRVVDVEARKREREETGRKPRMPILHGLIPRRISLSMFSLNFKILIYVQPLLLCVKLTSEDDYSFYLLRWPTAIWGRPKSNEAIEAQAQRSTLASNGQQILKFEFDGHVVFYNLMFDSQFHLQLQRNVNYCS